MRLAIDKFIHLPEEELKNAVKARLNGNSAGLTPINEAMCEPPADLLLSIYDFERDENFKSIFRNTLVSLLEEIPGKLVYTDTKYFRRLISLIGRLEIKTAYSCVKSLLLESKNIGEDTFNHKAIASVLESLEKAGARDPAF